MTQRQKQAHGKQRGREGKRSIRSLGSAGTDDDI